MFKIIKKNKNLFSILFLFFIIFFFLFVSHNQVKELKSVPACLYGCDYYFEVGISKKMTEDFNWYQSGAHSYANEIAQNPRSYFLLTSFFSKIFGFENEKFFLNNVYLSYLLIIFGLVFWYIFYSKIFKKYNNYLPLLLTIISFSLTNSPYFKYRGIINVFLPLLLYLFIKIIEVEKLDFKNKKLFFKNTFLILLTFLLFLFYTNIHISTFFDGLFMIFFLFLFFIIFPLKNKIILKNFKKITLEIIKKLKQTNSIILISISFVSLLFNFFILKYYYLLIFKFSKESTINKFGIHTDYTLLSNYFGKTFDFIERIFFNFNSIENSFFSLIFILSFVSFFILKYENKVILKYKNFILFYFIFCIFNYLFTVPLFQKHLSPSHSFGFLFPLLKGFFLGYFILLVYEYFKNKKNFQKIFSFLLIFLIFIFTINTIFNFNEKKEKDRFWEVGKREIPSVYSSFDKFVNQNDLTNNIFLSTNELSFAIFGVSSVDIISGRASHFFNFGDFQEYWLDAAIILYSNDTNKRESLIEKYIDLSRGGELYLYWDYYWINSDWQFDNEGRANPFDPLRFEDSEKLRKILDENQVKYFVKKNDIFEPSARHRNDIVKLDILYISPNNYNNYTNPWNNDLENYLEEVWRYEENGNLLGKLYKINLIN